MNRRLTSLEKARRQISRVAYTVNEKGCHIPKRLPNNGGYINTQFERKQIHLHRLVAYVYHSLNLSNPLSLALHKNLCHDRRCFNPTHLYVGNHSDNLNDASAIGNNPAQLEAAKNLERKLQK